MPCKEEYLNNVCREINFKAARKYLRRELGEHIDDKAKEFSDKGTADAEAAAVAAMGDAKETGRALNSVHKPRTEWGVIACMILLGVIGYVVISITSANDIAFTSGGSDKQLVTFVLGLGAMAAAYFFNYTLLVRLRYAFFAAALVLWALHIVHFRIMFVDQISLEYSQTLGVFDAVIIPLLFMMSILGSIEANRNLGTKGFIRVISLSTVSIAAASIHLDSFTSIALTVIYLIALFAASFQSNRKTACLRLLIAAGVVAAVYILLGFLRKPILEWEIGRAVETKTIWASGFDFSPDRNTIAVHNMLSGAQLIGPSPYYIQHQSQELGENGFSYILTSVVAAYGWLAGIGLLILFAALLAIMFMRSIRISHTFGRMLAIGISSFMLLRFAACVLTNTGFVDGVSCNLPFVSSGGFDFIANSLLLGLFLSVWRRSTFMKKDSISAGIPA